MYGNFQIFPSPTAEPAAAKINVEFPCQILELLIRMNFIGLLTSYTNPMVKNSKINRKPIIDNRQAKFNYELGEDFEAGISLLGWEVKSIRASRVDIKDSYILMKKGEAWLLGMSISPLNEVSHSVDPLRTRKLLLTKSELSKIFKGTQEKGLTCLPLKIYWKDNLIKMKISLGKGKSKFDKRESIRQKEWKKEKAKTEKLYRKFS